MKLNKHLRMYAVCAIVCLISFFSFTQTAFAETKTVNISLSTSTGVYETGSLSEKGDMVEYVLTTNDESSSYNIKLEPNSHYCELRVYDSKKQPLYIGTYLTIYECHFKLNAHSTYYFDIVQTTDSAVSYRFWMEQVLDESDTRTGAEIISFDVVNEASFCSNSYGNRYDTKEKDADYYKLRTGDYKRNYTLNAWSIDENRTLHAYLLNADGACLEQIAGVGMSGYPKAVVLEANTTYYLKLVPQYNGNFSYGFKVSTGSIIKEAQTIKVSPLKRSISYSKLKAATQSFALKVTAKTTPTCKKTSGNSKITVSSSGKVTVKKGLGKGTYTLKVKVSAPSSKRYKSTSKTVSIKITVS